MSPGVIRMADDERLTITLPSDLMAAVKGAVEAGLYATTTDVVQDALRAWGTALARQSQELALLRADIDHGLADLAAGRVRDFDAGRIAARGRHLLASDRNPAIEYQRV